MADLYTQLSRLLLEHETLLNRMVREPNARARELLNASIADVEQHIDVLTREDNEATDAGA